MFLLTSAVLIVSYLTRMNIVGGTEFGNWECHTVEKSARIVLVGRYAFLVRHAIFCCVYKVLSGSYYTNHREYSEAYEEISIPFLVIAKASVKSRHDGFGNIRATAATASAITACLFVYTCGEHDRINDLNHCLGNVLSSAAGLGKATEVIAAGRASEYANVAFSAIKDDLFLNDGNSLKVLRSAGTKASLKDQLYEKSDRNGIKSAVKSYGVDIDISPRYRRFLRANRACSLNNVVTHIGKVNANVFEAVAVAARVKDSVGFYTNGLFSAPCRPARKSALGSAI